MRKKVKAGMIIAPGLLLSHSGQINIDLNKWTTQAALTKKLGVGRNVVNNRVRRAVEKGTIHIYYIEALGVTLIPNVNSINEL